MSKYWEVGQKNKFGKECYKLHFSQFYEEENENVVAVFVQDETDEDLYLYASEELNGKTKIAFSLIFPRDYPSATIQSTFFLRHMFFGNTWSKTYNQ